MRRSHPAALARASPAAARIASARAELRHGDTQIVTLCAGLKMNLPLGLRRTVLRASRMSCVQNALRRTSEGPTVIFYHGVEEQIANPNVQTLHVPLREFEKQMRFLQRQREVISVEHLCQCLRTGHGLHSRQAVITFDDGYRNNLTIAAPLLQYLKFPFTVFVSTRHITQNLRFPTYYLRAAIWHTPRSRIRLRCLRREFPVDSQASRQAAFHDIASIMKTCARVLHDRIVSEVREQCSPDQWEELAAKYVSEAPMGWNDITRIRSMGGTIGAHGHDHLILHRQQPAEEIRRQLSQSKLAVEAHVGECKFMAYPNGTPSDISQSAYLDARLAGYRMCFTTIEAEVVPDADCYLAPRVFAPDDFEEFCYCLNRSGDSNAGYRAACRLFRTREFPATVKTAAHGACECEG